MKGSGKTMKGSRPLTPEEVREVCKAFVGEHAARDKALFRVGVATGYRISELLSLKVGDVYRFGRVTDTVKVDKKDTKGKVASRTYILNPEVQNIVAAWLDKLREQGEVNAETFLFKSRKGGNKPISRQQADQILRDAYAVCEMTGNLGTHSMRKTLAVRVYEGSGRDLVKTQKALGHVNINSTINYLPVDQEEVNAIMASITYDS